MAGLDRFLFRPHHGMCFGFFRGKGYSSDFTENMGRIVSYLETHPDTVLTLTAGVDKVCAGCPNQISGVCVSADKVLRYDEAVLRACGLADGEEITYGQMRHLVKEKILDAGMRRQICGDCVWDDICSKGDKNE